VTTGRLGL